MTGRRKGKDQPQAASTASLTCQRLVRRWQADRNGGPRNGRRDEAEAVPASQRFDPARDKTKRDGDGCRQTRQLPRTWRAAFDPGVQSAEPLIICVAWSSLAMPTKTKRPTSDSAARRDDAAASKVDRSVAWPRRAAARQARHPENKLPPVVHIAGTNGKGSVTAYLKAMLEAAGKRVHVYTSPHLVRFHERISLCWQQTASRAPSMRTRWSMCLMRVRAVNDGDDITQFEITTAAAFLAFSETPADIVLLEVGLGGRLDATNVIGKPALTIITPISMDHAEKLGPTLAKIAAEKAGILKRGVTGIVSQQDEEVLEVIAGARRKAVHAPLVVWGQDYRCLRAERPARRAVERGAARSAVAGPGWAGIRSSMPATAVAAAVKLSRKRPDAGLDRKGHRDRIAHGRMAGADAAPDRRAAAADSWDRTTSSGSTAGITRRLAICSPIRSRRSRRRSPKPVYLVVGMMGQKDALGFLAPFRGLVRDDLYGADPGRARSAALVRRSLPRSRSSAGLNAVGAGRRRCCAARQLLRAAEGPQAGVDLRLALSCRPCADAAGSTTAQSN